MFTFSPVFGPPPHKISSFLFLSS